MLGGDSALLRQIKGNIKHRMLMWRHLNIKIFLWMHLNSNNSSQHEMIPSVKAPEIKNSNVKAPEPQKFIVQAPE